MHQSEIGWLTTYWWLCALIVGDHLRGIKLLISVVVVIILVVRALPFQITISFEPVEGLVWVIKRINGEGRIGYGCGSFSLGFLPADAINGHDLPFLRSKLSRWLLRVVDEIDHHHRLATTGAAQAGDLREWLVGGTGEGDPVVALAATAE